MALVVDWIFYTLLEKSSALLVNEASIANNELNDLVWHNFNMKISRSSDELGSISLHFLLVGFHKSCQSLLESGSFDSVNLLKPTQLCYIFSCFLKLLSFFLNFFFLLHHEIFFLITLNFQILYHLTYFFHLKFFLSFERIFFGLLFCSLNSIDRFLVAFTFSTSTSINFVLFKNSWFDFLSANFSDNFDAFLLFLLLFDQVYFFRIFLKLFLLLKLLNLLQSFSIFLSFFSFELFD